MRFVLLHGRPAVGKLTVARALAHLTGYRVFDNHLVVDAALAVYDFGTPEFIALRDALWRAAIAEFAKRRAPAGLIFTFNPEHSVPQRFVDDLFATFAAAGVDMCSVALTCTETVLERRLAAADRRRKGKLVDLDLYRRLRAAGTFDHPRMPTADLTIDTAELSASEAAAAIAATLAPSH